MKIGIIGAGSLGSALGRRLAERRHEIMFGGGESAYNAAAEQDASAGTNAEAAAFGEVIVLAVPFAAIDCALRETGPVGDRVLWCCVNALKRDLSGLAVGFETSAAEEVARRAPEARVVSALPPFAHALSSNHLAYDRDLEPTVFLCADDDKAKQVVGGLVRDLGAQPVDAGPLSAARLVEPAMMLLVSIAYTGVPRDIALRLLERVGPPMPGHDNPL